MHPLRAGILLLRIRSEPNAAEIDRPMLDGLAEKSSDSALPQVRFHIDTFKKGDRRSAAAIHVIVAQSRFGKAHGGMRRRSGKKTDPLIGAGKERVSFETKLSVGGMRS
jgi:hypothetical protein